jgi:hypothetical protein
MSLVLLILLTVPAAQTFAQAKLAKPIIEESLHLLLRKSSTEAAEQLARLGGETAAREILEKASAEGGEALVRRVTALGLEHGPSALRVIKPAPAKIVGALDALSAELRPVALRALEREPAALTTLIERLGPEALEAAAKHPGVATTLGEKLGAEGLQTARSLTTDQAIIVARHADEIAALPAAQRAGVLAKLQSAPAAVVKILENNPKTLRTAAGVALILGLKNELFNPTPTIDGKPAGLLPRIWDTTATLAKQPAAYATTLLCALLTFWALVKARNIWKRRHAATA